MLVAIVVVILISTQLFLSCSTPLPIEQLEDTNTTLGVDDEMIYIPSTIGFFGIGYIPPVCQLNGVAYNVETKWGLCTSIREWLAEVEKTEYMTDKQLQIYIEAMKKDITLYNWVGTIGVTASIGGTIAAEIYRNTFKGTLFTDPVGFREKSMIYATIQGASTGIGFSLISIVSKDLQPQIQAIAQRYNLLVQDAK